MFDRRSSSVLAGGALAGGALAAGWGGVHLTSPAVRNWRRPDRQDVAGLPLYAATPPAQSGSKDPVVVLLHGLTATGISFSRHYDRLPATVVVPDLLGFGRSLSPRGVNFGRQAHITAVCALLGEMGLQGRPVVLVGHSMGAVLALHVAAALADVRGVVAFSAPLYDSAGEAETHVIHATPMARLFAQGAAAQRVCGWMCAHRQLAGLVWPVFAPRWPRAIAAAGVLHTWPAYASSLQDLVLDSDYRAALAALAAREVPVCLVNGGDDRVPVTGRAVELAAEFDNLRTESVPDADHDLPIARPTFCSRRVASQIRTWCAGAARSGLR